MKASTRCRLGRSEDGSATAWLEFQKADNGPWNTERYELIVNGKVTTSRTDWPMSTAQLTGNGPWKVSMVYKGSALYHPCASERTSTNPKETTYGGPH